MESFSSHNALHSQSGSSDGASAVPTWLLRYPQGPNIISGGSSEDDQAFSGLFDEHNPSSSRRDKQSPTSNRKLDVDNGDSYLVDQDGEEYEPYSLAWRYLGMFIDCEDDTDDDGVDDDDGDQDEERRHLSQDNDQSDSGCRRKVLWAAYRDPDYAEGTIGEYQFYNHNTGTYDDDFCQTERCVPLDCHEPETHFELVGVFKETDGLTWFTEQLFKHQGYCLWNSNQYEFMQTYQSYLPTYCTPLALPNSKDEPLWINVEPQPNANVGIGVYLDDKCTQPSKRTSMQDYIELFYQVGGGDAAADNNNNNNNNDHSGDDNKEQVYGRQRGKQMAKAWMKALKKWNQHMNIYKTCQPCRAYSLSSSGGNNNNNNRFLNEDGEGDAEQWGYDCYDDAGYTNCNQCYKFETQTYMEQATIYDLEQATKQGTILEIWVDEIKYGRGGFHPHFDWPEMSTILRIGVSVLGGIGLLVGVTLGCRRFGSSAMLGTVFQWVRNRFHRKDLPSSFKEHFHLEDASTSGNELAPDDISVAHLSYVY